MLARIKPGILQRDSRVAFYFRYRLRHGDFRELRDKGRLLGYFTAKPLFGRLTMTGTVDRAAGFNGRIAIIFIPARARTAAAARLMFTQMPPESVTLGYGRRNWPAIRSAAEKAIRRTFARETRNTRVKLRHPLTVRATMKGTALSGRMRGAEQE